MRIYLLQTFMLLVILMASSFFTGASMAKDSPVGFIWHYPFVDEGTSEIGKSGASMMIARVPWAVVEREDNQYDFASMDRQIQQAEQQSFKLTLLLECNPFCTPQWLRKQVTEAGESVCDIDGSRGDIPSTTSQVFAKAQSEFIHQVLEYVKAKDTRRVVTHYQVGVEWWFPYSFRHAPADVARFREWLKKRYQNIDLLNTNWDAVYTDFDQVDAPRVYVADLWQHKRVGITPLLTLDGADGSFKNQAGASFDWFEFWYETAAEYINSLAQIGKQADTSRKFVSFLTFSYALPAELDYIQWSAINPDDVMRVGSALDVLGMQLCVVDGDASRICAGLDLARKSGKSLWVLDLLDFVRGVHVSPKTMLRATHAAVQHGADGLQYCCWNGAKDFNFYPDWPMTDLQRMVTEGKQAIELMDGMKPQAQAAIILPVLPAVPGDATGYRNDPASFMGWYKLLESLHYTVDVVTIRELARDKNILRKYEWVLLPDCAVMPREAFDTLEDYINGGGRLIQSGRFVQIDPYNHPLIKGQFNQHPNMMSLPDYGKDYWGPLYRDNFAGDTPPLILQPEMTPQKVQMQREVRRSLRFFLQQHNISASVQLRPDNSNVTCVALGREAGYGAYLVNQMDEPVTGLCLRLLDTSASQVRVYVDLQEISCPMKQVGKYLELILPPFSTSCIVKPE